MALEGESRGQFSSASTQRGKEEGGDGDEKGRGLAGAINHLFAGRLMNYIEVR